MSYVKPKGHSSISIVTLRVLPMCVWLSFGFKLATGLNDCDSQGSQTVAALAPQAP